MSNDSEYYKVREKQRNELKSTTIIVSLELVNGKFEWSVVKAVRSVLIGDNRAILYPHATGCVLRMVKKPAL